jgi:heparosan-N-sulfate-glucuronate 5-epimerase
MKAKNLKFMASRFFSDLTKHSTYTITDDNKNTDLKDYYFQFEEDPGKLNKLIVKLDDRGIPLNTSYIDVEKPRLHYYPISIGQFGLALFSSYSKSNEDPKKEQFLNIADWFLENINLDEQIGTFWLTDIPKPEYKVDGPWKSAFAQSRALSILLRAWQLTGDGKYFKHCTEALKPYTFDISDGGVSAHQKDGHPFYEEYVASEPTMVLDGHLFSLFGIFDFLRAVPKSDKSYTMAERIFTEGVKSLEHWLPTYDLGFWVRFNYCQMDHYPETDPCTINYLKLIIAQLNIINRLSPSHIIKEYMDKFQSYDNKSNYLRMYPLKYKALKQLRRL